MITKDELIALLNSDLTKEYAAAVQYIQHQSLLTGPEYQSIQKELIIHANEEILHAIALSNQITFLGGMPTIDVDQRFTSADGKEMLEQDLAGELDAAKRYKKRIAQARELGEYGLERVLVDILIVEEEHARDLQAALGR